jgi:hypothetical protein
MDHKENTSCGVYRVFPSGFTISIYYFIIPYILDDYNSYIVYISSDDGPMGRNMLGIN